MIVTDLLSREVLYSEEFNYLPEFLNAMNRTTSDDSLRPIGAYDGSLWLLARSGKKVSINSVTGELTGLIDNSNSSFPSWHRPLDPNELVYFITNPIIDQKRGRIFELNRTYFIVADLNADLLHQEYIDLKDKPGFNDFEVVRSPEPAFDGQHLFVADGDRAKVAALNVDTLELDWVYQLDVEFKGTKRLRKIQLDGDKLYVLDESRCLHIFQRENNLDAD